MSERLRGSEQAVEGQVVEGVYGESERLRGRAVERAIS